MVKTGRADSSTVAQWYVVEFTSGACVQHLSENLAADELEAMVDIDEVSLDKAFVLLSSHLESNQYDDDEQAGISAHFASDSQISIARGDSGKLVDIEIQVVEINDSTVQSNRSSISPGNSSVTAHLEDTVDRRKSFLIYNWKSDSAVDGIEGAYQTRGVLSSSSQLSFQRHLLQSNIAISWFVVQLIGQQRVHHSYDASGPPHTQTNFTIDLPYFVDPGRTFPLVYPMVLNDRTDDLASSALTVDFSAENTLTMERGSALSRPIEYSYFVVGF